VGTGASRNPHGGSEALRGLIDGAYLTPDQGELQIELKGNLAAATEALRGLVDAVVLTPAASGEELGIERRGNLAAMPGATAQTKVAA
jgi:hypothetical protein